ncbi:hypothetical protein EJ02DRAFT_117462 [Clathrospora elynae]|uniref:Secreted protein n=1 Tax=Clathrospora elynae TaxID=706981 RepID=A0A6A5S4T9_9PLEO|nr:hypothetical protein EJ02DRAFT_117462 [Clathrospora elynae]
MSTGRTLSATFLYMVLACPPYPTFWEYLRMWLDLHLSRITCRLSSHMIAYCGSSATSISKSERSTSLSVTWAAQAAKSRRSCSVNTAECSPNPSSGRAWLASQMYFTCGIACTVLHLISGCLCCRCSLPVRAPATSFPNLHHRPLSPCVVGGVAQGLKL